MKPGECAQCGAEFEGPGIIHRGRFFCSDECCESWEDEFARNGEPEPDELDDELVPKDNLDFNDEAFEEDFLEEDDGLEIDPDVF